MNTKRVPGIRPRVATLVLAGAVSVTSGCAGTPSSTPPTTTTVTQLSTTTTTARQELTRVTGTITSSDVPGCLLLDAQIRQYQLVGDRAAGLQPGTRMTVTGLADPNTPGACGNSIPLTVDEAVPAEE